MKKFWKWKNQAATETMPAERTLHLSGTIAEESWFDDDVTPQLFREELMSGSGDITVWINSPGGDCVAAAQIYNMLMDYPGNVTVKIDGIAASAASVIAMAGTTVLMSPVSMMMIHNPMTGAFGDSAEMQKAIEMLASVKDSIINAYEIKTNMSRAKLSHLMDAETWMDANKAMELGFADGILKRGSDTEDMEIPTVSMMYSEASVVNSLMEKLAAKCRMAATLLRLASVQKRPTANTNTTGSIALSSVFPPPISPPRAIASLFPRLPSKAPSFAGTSWTARASTPGKQRSLKAMLLWARIPSPTGIRKCTNLPTPCNPQRRNETWKLNAPQTFRSAAMNTRCF